MAYYLLQAAYTREGWSNQMENPRDRAEALAPVIEKLGGRFEGAWLLFAEYDAVAIMEMPDNVSAAAFSMAASATPGIEAIKTTPLLTIDEGIEALRKGAEVGYRSPGE